MFTIPLHELIFVNKKNELGCSGLTPVIPAIGEAEIGRIMVQGQPRQKVSKTSS
jgi:hypothetical protein